MTRSNTALACKSVHKSTPDWARREKNMDCSKHFQHSRPLRAITGTLLLVANPQHMTYDIYTQHVYNIRLQGAFFTPGVFVTSPYFNSKCFQFAARCGLKSVTNISGRKPNATWRLCYREQFEIFTLVPTYCHDCYDIRKKFQVPPKHGTCASWSPQTRNRSPVQAI